MINFVRTGERWPTAQRSPAQYGSLRLSWCSKPEELRRNGIRVKVSGQALQVLIVLASEPGRLVTREHLHKVLWPETSFGDFEHGLNAAVNRLREILGDSAVNPKYIETIPRQGYRFIAATKVEDEQVKSLPHVASTEPPKLSAKPSFGRWWIPLAVAACLLISLGMPSH